MRRLLGRLGFLPPAKGPGAATVKAGIGLHKCDTWLAGVGFVEHERGGQETRA